MSPVTIIHTLGSTGVFPSRAFIPAFVTAVVLRYGHHLPFLADNPLLRQVEPSWLTSDWALGILAVLSIIEILAAKDPDLRQFMDQTDRFIKPIMAAVTMFGLLSATDRRLIESIQEAGFAAAALALVCAGGVFVLVEFRLQMLEFLDEFDSDNSLGLHSVFGWAEDLWSSLGVLMLFLLPLFTMIMMAIVVALMALVRRRLRRLEVRSQLNCPNCSAPNYPCARRCHDCKETLPSPCDIGFLGVSKPETTADPETLPLRLIEKKRCPVCAAYLEKRKGRQACSACGYELFNDAASINRYDETIRQRQWRVLAVTLVLSLIPVVGIIPGIVYYRAVWVAPYRRYTPAKRTFSARVLIGLVSFCLLAIQWLPFFGGLSLPLMALINHTAYRRAFLMQFSTRKQP